MLKMLTSGFINNLKWIDMDLDKLAEKIVDSKLTRDETIAYAKVLIREYAKDYHNKKTWDNLLSWESQSITKEKPNN